MHFEFNTDPDHVKRERKKAQELRQSSWWKQQVGPGRCHHCGGKFAKELLTMDHVVPVARGGKSTKKNCVPSCKSCNTEKGALFSVERTFLALEAERAIKVASQVETEDQLTAGPIKTP